MTATADSGIRVTIMITTVAVSDLVFQIPKENRMTNSKAHAVFLIHKVGDTSPKEANV